MKAMGSTHRPKWKPDEPGKIELDTLSLEVQRSMTEDHWSWLTEKGLQAGTRSRVHASFSGPSAAILALAAAAERAAGWQRELVADHGFGTRYVRLVSPTVALSLHKLLELTLVMAIAAARSGTNFNGLMVDPATFVDLVVEKSTFVDLLVDEDDSPADPSCSGDKRPWWKLW